MSEISSFYINLDSAIDRRSHIERMWASNKSPYPIQRFTAIKPDFSLGDLSVGETGCIFSHLKIWENNINSKNNVIILEDDAIICKNFHQYVSELILSQSAPWDILFQTHTEPINDLHRMRQLLKLHSRNYLN